MVASACHHLRNPGEEFVQSVVFNHAVEFTNVFQVLAHAVQRLGQVFRILLQFLGALDDLLMQDLVAVNEIAHPTAEYWATLSHLDANLTLSTNQIWNSPGIFYFSGCLDVLLKILLVFLK